MPATASTIHPTAVIHPSAELGTGVEIGPYCVLHEGVTLGDGCWLQNHVTIAGPSTIGPGNRFFAFTSVGQQSQDLKYEGEPTSLEIGGGNTFREFVTVNRGTAPGSKTAIGSGGSFLAYSHIAHDCTVGDHVIFSNNGTLAGHVEVGDYAILGGLTAVHQFCRIGAHSLTGGCSKIVQDVPPFTIADGNPATVRGVNATGLIRRGVSEESVNALKRAYRTLYKRQLNLTQALGELRASPEAAVAEVAALLDFATTSSRGIIR
ncbi:MAG TPA: acyl-ACP--UDP-N-acetylglucosamine O-acyltransferase [Verrucomicrobiae bacterium]|nr:acyl-ACP--UDP-N-acetylglucosamine O-acyltransferase [Verrucomicrobiae bacterium]